MKHRVLFAVSLGALALAACKKEAPATQDTPTATATDVAAGAIPGALAPSLTPAQAFANAAAASDAFEIETSKLAAANSQSAAIKRFADKMIDAHTQSTEKLKSAAGSASPAITPDASLTDAQQQILDGLKPLSGAEFDKAYAKAQVDGHQATLDALKAYATSSGAVPSLKAFATAIIPTVTAHLNMAKAL